MLSVNSIPLNAGQNGLTNKNILFLFMLSIASQLLECAICFHWLLLLALCRKAQIAREIFWKPLTCSPDLVHSDSSLDPWSHSIHTCTHPQEVNGLVLLSMASWQAPYYASGKHEERRKEEHKHKDYAYYNLTCHGCCSLVNSQFY